MVTMLFDAAGLAMVGWALMIFLPGWRVTRVIVRSQLFPLLLAALYTVGVVAVLLETGPGVMADFGSSAGVIGLLADPRIALVAWIHILAFDHLVAVVIFRDNAHNEVVPMPVQSLILLLTLMFGPAGLLAYCGARALRGHPPAPALMAEAA